MASVADADPGGPLQLYTRYLVRQHLWCVSVVTLLLVTIVTLIHVSSYIENTLDNAVQQGRSGIGDLAMFVGLRASDVLSQVVPIALVLGIIWSETSISLSGRRLMMQAAGRSAWAGVPALLIVAAIAVVAQFTLTNVVRPAAVLALIDRKIGNYDEYVDREPGPHGHWIGLPGMVIQARSIDDAGVFEKIVIFHFSQPDTLDAITVAERLLPPSSAGRQWRMEDGYDAALPVPQQVDTAENSVAELAVASRFGGREMALRIDPLWLAYRGIQPIYVPLAELVQLSASTAIPADQPDYRAALHVRLARSLNPALLMLVVIATFYIASRRLSPHYAAGLAVLAAYVGTVAADAAGVVGQGNGALGAWASPWLLLVFCVAGARQLQRTTASEPLAADLPDDKALTLEAAGLTKSYDDRAAALDVSVTVTAGEVVGLFGPSGSGKSTVFGMMAGVVDADDGTVRMGDAVIDGLPLDARTRLGIAYLPQSPQLFADLTVEQNLQLALEGRGRGRRALAGELDILIAGHELNAHRRSRVAGLSGGERKRCEFAYIMSGRPRFLLLDEPLTGLDPIMSDTVRQRVRALARQGMGVLVTEHKIRDAFDMVDRAYIIADGRIIAAGTPAELLANEAVQAFYLGGSADAG